jgi:hypothetical protein
MFVGSRARPTNKAGNLAAICEAILNISKPYKPLRHITGIALHFYMYMMFVPHRKHTYKSPPPVMRIS